MSRIVILGFESSEQADAAREIAEQLQRKGELDLRGMAVGCATNVATSGSITPSRLPVPERFRAPSAAGVVGLFILAPLLGAAVGAAGGAIGSKLGELGLDQLVVKDILEALEPGRAAPLPAGGLCGRRSGRRRASAATPDR